MPSSAAGTGLALWLFAACSLSFGQTAGEHEKDQDFSSYLIRLGRPDGRVVPAIVGTSTSSLMASSLSSLHYLEWSGVNYLRFWFKPDMLSPRHSLNWRGGVSTYNDFRRATDAIRATPLRQGTKSDCYIDWKRFLTLFGNSTLSGGRSTCWYVMESMKKSGIKVMIVSTSSVSKEPLSHWGDKFEYWKYWYMLVYHFSSRYGVEIYQMCNEPHARFKEEAWASNWIVAADAIRAAAADVNRDRNSSLNILLSGPVESGTYWDYDAPATSYKGWCSRAWTRINHNLLGEPVDGLWNLGHFDYHQYTASADKNEATIRDIRKKIATARNNPRPGIPITISEINVLTGSKSFSRKTDPEDLSRGVSTAAMLHATAAAGDEGLGPDGGFWYFKLGSVIRGKKRVVLPSGGNTACWADRANYPHNFGGVRRGGAVLNMYAEHFNRQQPLLAVTETIPVTRATAIRTMACHDRRDGRYSVFGSLLKPPSDPQAVKRVSIDIGDTTAAEGTYATLQRVDEFNVGQVTDIIRVGAGRVLSFAPSGITAWHLRIPEADRGTRLTRVAPEGDSYVTVGSNRPRGREDLLAVSTHHSDQARRNIALMRFTVEPGRDINQVLVSFSGRNAGRDPAKREILHVYLLDDRPWDEHEVTWSTAPGVRKYLDKQCRWQDCEGTGPMVAIEDNYGGEKPGTGLGLCGRFIGQVSFYSGEFQRMHLDVTGALRRYMKGGTRTFTLLFARIVRYNVNYYDGPPYYNVGVYHYNDRLVTIASREHADETLRPHLSIIHSGERAR